ncbi:MAG: hypothetical protein P1V33_03420 [Pseudohongiella nitratireducens]|nr:hypothetical protein [Pseudohongiella nitratireducens]MDF1622504.1 hypothetical protein [Pseudohongiella nitratireducens]
MDMEDRMKRLETLALNQTLIIEHLSQAIAGILTNDERNKLLDKSAEDLLELVFTDGVPLSTMSLAVEWRNCIGRSSIMPTS